MKTVCRIRRYPDGTIARVIHVSYVYADEMNFQMSILRSRGGSHKVNIDDHIRDDNLVPLVRGIGEEVLDDCLWVGG